MKRRTLLAGSAALAAAPLIGSARAQAAKTKIVWWHAMTGPLGDQVTQIVTGFNGAQNTVEVEAIYKGGYADLMTATIAAFRAGEAPNLTQIFEVGTENMIAAGKATKEVWELSKETGVHIDPKNYIPAVRGYYSLTDGRMASMPFNSSTAVMWINKDAFQKADLDPDKPPATWDDVTAAAKAIKAKNAAEIPMNTSWFSWIMLEQYSAIHNIPFATKANGFEGLDAVLQINSKPHVAIIARLLEMSKDGTFKYGGRDNAPDPVFLAGQSAITFNSSAYRGALVKSAKFAFAPALLPYDPGIAKEPINSIIGGASLWPMTTPKRTAAEYKAVAEFLQFIGKPNIDATWAENTGYVPVTLAGAEEMKKQGWFDKNPGTELPIQQLERGHVTNNSRGIRLGRLPEIRNIIQEEFEKALQGGVTAQQVMDNAVQRGNAVLRQFQKSVKA
ncbi:MAG TPA: sn-glycerol-3-phosphate ABC transporter substrate-binding protein UgpB [Acetobacteraceae bacterium]|nr:sn-glycerol-3-phosphate ABC transporter substrate-binding protein UgpB [Acetobacteraceae bacterium]